MAEENEMAPEVVDENLSLEEISERKRWQKVIELREGKYVQTGEVRKCRKIYFNIEYGKIRFEITGQKNLTGSKEAPFSGGPYGAGGGAYDWGNITNLKIIAETPAKFYVHVEWTVYGPFDVTFGG
ncbi:hypothetical protein NE848_05795 [Gramella jeungdoensis]|uniref:Uncharacterized protein n=1 Tax=Gramella jeungdoensis TaxID=708091 RepID=A0ABT0YZI1_9FLAO|nr:hypothetical protein [Gramella jeungdoensis]MCM8568880.1 hypothetical protein [Gramella jeungdoensis]